MARSKQDRNKLTAKEAHFAKEYLVDLNTAAAARRAGYSLKTADRMGYRLIRRPRVAAAIKAAMDSRAGNLKVTTEQILAEIDELAMADIGQVIDLSGFKSINQAKTKFIRSIKVRKVPRRIGKKTVLVEEIEIQVWNKVESLNLAGRHRGVFVEKHEVAGPAGGPIQVIEVVKPAPDPKQEGGTNAV